jgi:serine/threonine protein kinase
MADISIDQANKTSGDLTGQVLGKRYQLLERVGIGAMGTVYRAEHQLMKKTVAIKLLHGPMLEKADVMERFMREAQAASNIDHPNVCAATEFEPMDDGSFFLVMEFLSGHTIKDLLKKEGPLSAARVASISLQVAAGLSRAHKTGREPIVHRDLKPDNIFLVHKDDNKDFVKIVDFGIARVQLGDEKEAAQLTQAGMIYGTPQYMSPEQANGEAVDLRTDLYSLGVVMYEMMTGRPPFDGANLMQLLWKHVSETPPPMAEVAPPGTEIHPGLEAITLKLLEKSPDARYARSEDLLDALWSLNLHDRRSAQGMFSLSGVTGIVSDDEAQDTQPPPTLSLSKTGPQPLPNDKPTSSPPPGAPKYTLSGLPEAFRNKQGPAALKAISSDLWHTLRDTAGPPLKRAWTKYRALPPGFQVIGAVVAALLMLWIIWPSSDPDPISSPSDTAADAVTAPATDAPVTLPDPTTPPTALDTPKLTTTDGAQAAFSIQALLDIEEIQQELSLIKSIGKKRGIMELLRMLRPHYDTNLAAYVVEAEAHALGGSDKDAFTAYDTLLKQYPQAIDDDRVLSGIETLLTRKNSVADNAPEFLSRHRSPRLISLLILNASVGEGTQIRNRFRGYLKNLGEYQKLPPWAVVAVEMGDGTLDGTCPKRRVFVNQIAEFGDPAALNVIRALFNSPTNNYDNHKCMRPHIAYALEKLEAIRDGREPPPRPPELDLQP